MCDCNTLKITLPWPPTVNTYFSHIIRGKRVVTIPSKKGTAYQKAAAIELMLQGVAHRRLGGRLAVQINAYPPDKRKRDLDNLLKAMLDALTKSEVWIDDSQVDDLRIVRGHVVKNGRIDMTVTEVIGR